MIFLFSMAFYLFTLAPGTFWSDPAQLTNRSLDGWEMSPDARHYPLFTAVAKILVQPFVPLRDLAYGMNVLDALFGALALVLLYRLVLALGASRAAAAAGACSLMIAHTIWQHCVVTEVYTLSLFLTLALMLPAVLWTKEKPGYLYLSLFMFGFGFFQHRFHILTVSPYFLYLWLKRNEFRRKDLTWGVGCFFIGLLPIIVISMQYLFSGHSLGNLIHDYLFSKGKDWEKPITGVDWRRFGDDAVYMSAFFVYNFVGLALPLGFAGLFRSFRVARKEAWLLAGLAATGFAFSFDYNIGEKWQFFMPMYLIFAIWVGLGADWLLNRLGARRRLAAAAMLSALFVIPIFTYWATPLVLNRMNLNPFKVAEAREYHEIFFNPNLHHYARPLLYSQRVFEVVPPGSILLGDYAAYQVLLYYQRTRGLGREVRLVFLDYFEAPLLENQLKGLGNKKPIYLALWPYHKLYVAESLLRLSHRADLEEPIFRVDKAFY